MASASPNAFGAALSFPGRQVIALCGDGGFTMLGLGDLLTQVQRKTRVVNVIFNNGSLDFVNLEQQEAGILPFGTDFVNPNFSQVATALGARAIRVEEPGDLPDALRSSTTARSSCPPTSRPRRSRASRSASPSRCAPGHHRSHAGSD